MVVSLHDKKPVCLMSSIIEEIIQIKKKKKVQNSEKTTTIDFFKLNIINKYNHNIGSADIADQL